jgi:hypothetical protein
MTSIWGDASVEVGTATAESAVAEAHVEGTQPGVPVFAREITVENGTVVLAVEMFA